MKKYFCKKEVGLFKKELVSIKRSIKNGDYQSDDGKFGIAGNTFRAFHGHCKPSIIYREWAEKVSKSILGNGKSIGNQDNFDFLHSKLCKSIEKCWKNTDNPELKFAHKYKMIDLYFKWLCANVACHESMRDLSEEILKFGHCPLDKNSLTKLNECLSFALPIKNPSMGSIHNKNTYDFCQYLIKEFTKYCGGTPLLFDFYVWPPDKQ